MNNHVEDTTEVQAQAEAIAEHLLNEYRESELKAMLAAEAAEKLSPTKSLVVLDDNQIAVLKELDLYDGDTVDEMARAALASVIKGKMQAAIDRAIKAKYLAEGKGKKTLAEECEAEIQRGLALKRKL
jgi:hypothetical protein